MDLHIEGGQVLLQDQVQRLLRGGDTLAEQQSEQGQTRAFQARNIVRAYLNAPEGRPSDLQFPGWLVKENQLPPENWPQNVRKDVRARFTADKLPPDIAEYLQNNPEKAPKPKESTDGKPARAPREFTLPADNLPSRLRAMSDVLQFAPKEIQEPLLRLGAEDARALKDIVQVVTPPKTARDRAQPPEFAELLKLTVPQAHDIYTVKLLIQAIRDANWAKSKDNTAAYDANHAIAMKAAQQLMPNDLAGQGRVIELVDGLASGDIRAPWVDRDAEVPEVPKPGVGKHTGNIERQNGRRPDEEYPMESPLPEPLPGDDVPPDEFPDPLLGSTNGSTPAGEFNIDDWRPSTEQQNDAAFDGIEDAADANNAVDPGLIDEGRGDEHGL
jgi:hypothetical protein